MHTTLDAAPVWLFIALALVLTLLAHDAGYRIGRKRNRQTEREHDALVGGMVAAELGLLAFLLAFTFSMAASRYDTRRSTLLDEANAIGTTYLRAGLLPEPYRVEVRRLLREYVDVRIAAIQSQKIDHAIHKSEELHAKLWTEAAAAAETDPRSVPIGLFVASVNEVIDLHAKRVTAGTRSRIPMPVWVVLFSVAVLSFSAIGYNGGLTGRPRSPAVFAVAVSFVAVLWLVADLDRPGEGMLRVSQQPMIDLRASMGP